MRYGGDVQVYGRDGGRRRMRYGDDPAFTEEYLYVQDPGRARDPDMRRSVDTVARGRMSPDQLELAQELRLAREAGMLVEVPARYGDARENWLPLGDIVVPASGQITGGFIANFTFKMTGFRCASSEGTGLVLEDLTIDRKSQLLRNGGVNLELCSEVTTANMVGDTANRGAEIGFTFRNWTLGELTLHAPVLLCAVAR